MARKAKIPNHIAKRFQREEKERKIEVRNQRKYYLIVCEGEKTEPNYFESIRCQLPKGVLKNFCIRIQGTGFSTKSLVRKANEVKLEWEKETGRPVDKLWVVFDRDSFLPDDFNGAIVKCSTSKSEIKCAWTNEAFELWYLLHFHYYNSPIKRTDFQGLIEDNIKQKLPHFRYTKNNKEMHSILNLYGSEQNAIRNAKKLEREWKGRADYSNHNPCTTVHKLIEELNALKVEQVR